MDENTPGDTPLHERFQQLVSNASKPFTAKAPKSYVTYVDYADKAWGLVPHGAVGNRKPHRFRAAEPLGPCDAYSIDAENSVEVHGDPAFIYLARRRLEWLLGNATAPFAIVLHEATTYAAGLDPTGKALMLMVAFSKVADERAFEAICAEGGL